MLAELQPFHDYAATTAHLADVLRRIRAEKGFHHPILGWIKSNPQHGPALFFDIHSIEQRMQWLGEVASPLAISPLLAVKSCPDMRYLKAAQQQLAGYDVSNPAEYACLPETLQGKLVSITSPDLSGDMRGFVSRGNTAVISLDSETQLTHYFGQQSAIPYVLRIQGSELLKNTEPADPAYLGDSRFGFTIEEVKRVLQRSKLRAKPPSGFHVHQGSECNQASTFRSIVDGLNTLVRQQAITPKFINLGGGWHAMSQQDIREVLSYARSVFPAPCAILLEPGRWFSEDAGFAVCTISNQMRTGDTIKYTVNLSKKCHLHWSEPKLIYPLEAPPKKVREVHFFGPSCYEEDRLGKFLLPYRDDLLLESGLGFGRQLIFSGINTYSAAWNTSFNGIPKAEISWWSSPS